MYDLIELEKRNKKIRLKLFIYTIIVLSFLILSYFFLLAPISQEDKTIHISPNDSLVKISKELKDKNIIRSPFLLKSFIFIFLGDKNIKSGDYLFKKKSNIISVALQISNSRHGVLPIKIRFIEGITNEEIIQILEKNLSSFNKDLFLKDERTKQGYLFPDTYFFFPLSSTDEVIEEMSRVFKKRISSLDDKIKSSGRSLSDIIIMASIIEKEAAGKNDSAIISDILWKRISIGMPLQVDADPSTYKKIGLPEAPISNPGLFSIRSAILPEKSPYLFYLHDNNRQVHYARDFKEHRNNILKYLK